MLGDDVIGYWLELRGSGIFIVAINKIYYYLIYYNYSPAGWDNLKKISILYENMHACKADDYYSDIIAQPPSRKTVSNRETEVQTEDEQLIKQQLKMWVEEYTVDTNSNQTAKIMPEATTIH